MSKKSKYEKKLPKLNLKLEKQNFKVEKLKLRLEGEEAYLSILKTRYQRMLLRSYNSIFDPELVSKEKELQLSLYKFLDERFEQSNYYGYIERTILFDRFKNRLNSVMPVEEYKKNNKLMTSQKFKLLIIAYCEEKGLRFNPTIFISDHKRGRIMRTSTNNQKNKHGHVKTVEFFYINTEEGYIKDYHEVDNK